MTSDKLMATLIDGSVVAGTLTTEHPASSYGQPVFVSDDGQAVDWAEIVRLTVHPRTAAAAMGAITTPRKAQAARANGRRPIRPGSRPRGRPREEARKDKGEL